MTDEALKQYLERFRVPGEVIEALDRLSGEILERQIIVFWGKGRSGFASKIGMNYLGDVLPGKEIYSAESSPGLNHDKLASKSSLVLLTSGSGETVEVTGLARDFQNLKDDDVDTKVASFTYHPDSTLSGYSDITVRMPEGVVKRPKVAERSFDLDQILPGREEVVSEDEPTMGDLAEELFPILFYTLAHNIYARGRPGGGHAGAKSPNEVIDYMRGWLDHEELNDDLEPVKVNLGKYNKLAREIKVHRNSGIRIYSHGPSEQVSNMIVNRSNHYGIECAASSGARVPPLDETGMLLVVSSSAGDYTQKIVRTVRESPDLNYGSKKPYIFAVVGRHDGWLDELCDDYLVIGDSKKRERPYIRGGTTPEVFYALVPILINGAMRKVASELKLTKKYAKNHHGNY
jgi:hypothetical protein